MLVFSMLIGNINIESKLYYSTVLLFLKHVFDLTFFLRKYAFLLTGCSEVGLASLEFGNSGIWYSDSGLNSRS